MSVTYTVEDMRVILPKGKVADNNPDRFCTVHGTFYNEKNEALSFSSKEVTRDMALDPVTVIDIENGILTLPSGERGRKPSASISADEVSNLLDTLRNPAAE
jgi:hypothetical protein